MTPRTRSRRLAIAAALALIDPPVALADGPPPGLAIAPPVERRPVPGRSGSAHPAGDPAGGPGGWWMGTAAIAAALAVVGGASVASKRFPPGRDSGPLRVVGRASLSPKHSVYLLRVGDRVLIVAAGPQGPPASLGEVTDPAELARLAPRRGGETAPTSTSTPTPTSPARVTPGFDRRIGDAE